MEIMFIGSPSVYYRSWLLICISSDLITDNMFNSFNAKEPRGLNNVTWVLNSNIKTMESNSLKGTVYLISKDQLFDGDILKLIYFHCGSL